MANHALTPPRDPPDKGRVPEWMRRDDELAQTTVLLMQVRKTEENSNGLVMRLPPDHFLIGNAILLALGSSDAQKVRASKEAGGAKYILRTKSKTVCEKLKQIYELPDKTPVEIVEHPILNTVQGVVFEPDGINQSEEYILEHLRSQGVTAVRRIKKRVGNELRNTPLTVLTFSGIVLPEYVLFGLLRIPVRRYYPTPMICFRCANYGHTRKKCDTIKVKQVCLTCSDTHDAPESSCTKPEYCKHCTQNHSPISKQCAVYREEEAIIRLKIDRSLSYSEARSEFRKASGSKSYAAIAHQSIRNEENEKDRIIISLQKQVSELTRIITELRTEIAAVNKQGCTCKKSTENVTRSSARTDSLSQTGRSSKNCFVELTRSSSCDGLQTGHESNQYVSNADDMEYEQTRSNKRKGNTHKVTGSAESPERKKCPTSENSERSDQPSGYETRSKKK